MEIVHFHQKQKQKIRNKTKWFPFHSNNKSNQTEPNRASALRSHKKKLCVLALIILVLWLCVSAL